MAKYIVEMLLSPE